jgi:hypothetical protein
MNQTRTSLLIASSLSMASKSTIRVADDYKTSDFFTLSGIRI